MWDTKEREISLLLKCPACRIPQVRLIDVGNMDLCPPCAIAEINLGDKDALEHVLPFIVEHKICAYCGEYGTDREHVVPRCTHLPTWTVYACRECNGIAGGRLFASFGSKRAHIKKRLWRKYYKVLTMPEWTHDELAQLSYRLRQYVENGNDARAWVTQRINFDIAVQDIIEARIGKIREIDKEVERVAPLSTLRPPVSSGPLGSEVLHPEMPHIPLAENQVQSGNDPATHQSAQP